MDWLPRDAAGWFHPGCVPYALAAGFAKSGGNASYVYVLSVDDAAAEGYTDVAPLHAYVTTCVGAKGIMPSLKYLNSSRAGKRPWAFSVLAENRKAQYSKKINTS